MDAARRIGFVLGRKQAFRLTGYAFLVLFVGTTIPTPLYRLYQHELGFSSSTLTLIFAVYVAALVPSLMLFGQISDRVGRRVVLLIGFAIAALAAVLFAVADGLAFLFVARALQGVATGIVAGAGTAALSELEPSGSSRRASFVVSAANAAGAALGPLFGGLFAEYGPWPTRLPYVVYLLTLLPVVAMAFIPETVLERRPLAVVPRLPAVPPAIRREFAFAGAASFLVWAAAALYLTLAPGYVAMLLDVASPAIGGAVVSLMLAASTLAQTLWRGLPHRVAMTVGLALLPVGLAALVAAGPLHSAILLLAGTLTVGAGHGLAFLGSLVLVNKIAPETQRAEVASAFYVVSYIGVALPAIAVGFGAQLLGLATAVTAFSSLIGLLAVLLLATAHRGLAEPSVGSAAP